MDSYPNNKRPLSAIFLGNPSTHGALGSLSQIQTQSGFQHSPNNGGSGLPSPPATNSTASTGKESVPKRVRKTSIAFATVKSMLTGDRREQERERERERLRNEEEDEEPMDDEDHTARLSGPAASTSSGGSLILGRSTSAGARSTTSSGRMDRVKSLADRNRMVLDKLSSLSSAASSRLHSPAPTDRTPLTASTLRSRGVSPLPPISANTLFPPQSNSATGLSPRGSHASLTSPNVRHSRDLEPETPSPAARFSPSDSTGGSSGRGSDQAQPRASAVARQTSVRDTPRMRQIEFTNDHEQPSASRDRERLYESQRAPAPAFTVSGDGAGSGMRREGSVRVSFSRSRHEIDPNEFGVRGGGAAQQGVYSSEDDRSTTPPADSGRRHVTDPVPPTPATRRERRISITEPKTSPSKEREPLRTRPAAGTFGRQRNSSENVIERTVAAARKSPVRPRGALPSEFRSGTESKRASIDNKRMSLDGKRTFSSPRTTTSPEMLRRDSGYARPATAGGSRSATVREPRRIQSHSRWASEDTTVDMNDPGSRPRYERRGGSIESPLTPGGRSVVGESFKAAGLTKRRDPEEPASAVSSRTSDSRNSVDWEVEQLREGIARVGVGDMSIGEEDESEKEDPRTPPAHNRAPSRNIHHIMTSRPGTSSGAYIDDGPRTAPPALRPYRSMGTGLATPSGSGTVRERGATPVTPASLVSTASTEHVRLMLESFAMFESNLARLEGSSPGGNGGSVTELLQNADVVVQASQSLNTILRRAAAKALTEQIEAEVEDRSGAEMEIWKVAGGEFRDSLKVSDELVRSMTNLLLGMGRVLKERGGDADEVRSSGRLSSSELRSGRMSAEGSRARTSEGNRFPEGSRVVEERRNSEVRRSLDGDTLRRMTTREYDPLRPQTSMSLLRERNRGASPISDSQVRLASTGTSRRFFPGGDPDASFGTDGYQSPSPAVRRLGEHRRERVLSIPPRLESVPSESIVRKTDKPTPTISRRPRIAAGTIRGAMPFATPAPAPAPAHLSTAVAVGNGSPEKPQRSMSYSVSRSGGAATMSAMSGLQAQARKRTISSADPLEPELESPLEAGSGSGTQRLQSTITRGRPSMDFSADESSASGAERKARRRTATELFT